MADPAVGVEARVERRAWLKVASLRAVGLALGLAAWPVAAIAPAAPSSDHKTSSVPSNGDLWEGPRVARCNLDAGIFGRPPNGNGIRHFLASNASKRDGKESHDGAREGGNGASVLVRGDEPAINVEVQARRRSYERATWFIKGLVILLGLPLLYAILKRF